MTAGRFTGEGKDAMQIEVRLSDGYSIYLIADAFGLSFISNETGSNVTIGHVDW